VERVLSVAFIREFESPSPFYDSARAELNDSTSQLAQAMPVSAAALLDRQYVGAQ
jgi:hypothetical protein